jgi:hypothetical protein
MWYVVCGMRYAVCGMRYAAKLVSGGRHEPLNAYLLQPTHFLFF